MWNGFLKRNSIYKGLEVDSVSSSPPLSRTLGKALVSAKGHISGWRCSWVGLFREGLFSFKRQWEARFDKAGGWMGILGGGASICQKEAYLNKINRRMRLEEESKTSFCSLLWGQRVKEAYLAPGMRVDKILKRHSSHVAEGHLPTRAWETGVQGSEEPTCGAWRAF